MKVSAAAALLLAVLPLAACVSAPPPTTVVQVSVEDQKKEIARLRNTGAIGYEEAARRQYAIQRGAYSLTASEVGFWETSIALAREVDRRRLTPADYQARVQAAYALMVGGRG